VSIGEVRGEEAFDMLLAVNTEHQRLLTSVHANSQRDALLRIENMVSMANLNIPGQAIRRQIASAIHAVVQVSRLSDWTRKVMTISEVTGVESDVISIQDIFVFHQRSASFSGYCGNTGSGSVSPFAAGGLTGCRDESISRL
jgi:pilus assembly protein CpaF